MRPYAGVVYSPAVQQVDSPGGGYLKLSLIGADMEKHAWAFSIASFVAMVIVMWHDIAHGQEARASVMADNANWCQQNKFRVQEMKDKNGGTIRIVCISSHEVTP